MEQFKKERKLKVYEKIVRRECGGWYTGSTYKTVPEIRLQGEWLDKLGFEPRTRVKVECEKGKIVITLND